MPVKVPPAPSTQDGATLPAAFRGEAELIVVSTPAAGLRATLEGLQSVRRAPVAPLTTLLGESAAELRPVFGLEEVAAAKARRATEVSGIEVPDLSLFYRVQLPDGTPAEARDRVFARLLDRLAGEKAIDGVYVKPPTIPPLWRLDYAVDVDNLKLFDVFERFTSRQGYLDPAPGGVDARWAWTQTGGRGDGVQIIDIEGNWRFTHEDLTANQGGVVAGTRLDDVIDWRNHGTAVLGEISGDQNLFGITGIAPNANIRTISHGGIGSSSAIRQSADLLSPGDLILLEMHRPGPLHDFASRNDQDGYIAVEWWEDDFAAIRYAVARGIVVVEAAGNGAQDLDGRLYETRPSGFPSGWTNPFRRANRDSGAIVVGAGAPPVGTHGFTWGNDRSRLGFSNWGALVDAQGWGGGVTTTGYGDLQGGTDEDRWYTDDFGGTSSASPIVTGALAATQGVLKARGRIPLSPARARALLRSTGSAQQDEPSRPATQRIGNLPDLRSLVPEALRTVNHTGTQFTGSLAAGQTARWFTFGWPAHWHVYWTVVPTIPRNGVRQLRWKVQVERASDATITYWIEITNLTSASIDVEARFAVLGQ
ncbi:S8 family serine peptidase [Xylanimonas protaetiae]|uniref:Serine protease n=1 Tax=Xylanimonas protaetiae TaxID=2509457 RepID=A0A4P6FA86_9MICO|nr:S8 family serine peptidase [Xylanimonas protaetiae]QAY71199.1 serine protease [Xylanimonas protaetiae]